jgi:hypothetical protein
MRLCIYDRIDNTGIARRSGQVEPASLQLDKYASFAYNTGSILDKNFMVI